MRTTGALVALWTLVVIVIVLLWPSGVDTPGCARMVQPPPDCAAQVAEANDAAWTRTVPMLLIIGIGYVLVLAAGMRARVQAAVRR